MTEWTREAVLTTAAAWLWVPYGAVVADTEHARVVVFRDEGTVHRVDPPAGTAAPEFAASVLALAKEEGAASLLWPVHDLSRPEGIAAALLATGATIDQDLDVSAYPLDRGVPALDVPAGVRIVEVTDSVLLRDCYVLESAVFGSPPKTEEFAEEESRILTSEVARLGDRRSVKRYIAYDGDEPVGLGGGTLEKGVLKLWGAGVLESHRGRGLYRALLERRLADGVRAGAEIALVKARTGTSSPILRKAGFETYGRETHYRVEW